MRCKIYGSRSVTTGIQDLNRVRDLTSISHLIRADLALPSLATHCTEPRVQAASCGGQWPRSSSLGSVITSRLCLVLIIMPVGHDPVTFLVICILVVLVTMFLMFLFLLLTIAGTGTSLRLISAICY